VLEQRGRQQAFPLSLPSHQIPYEHCSINQSIVRPAERPHRQPIARLRLETRLKSLCLADWWQKDEIPLRRCADLPTGQCGKKPWSCFETAVGMTSSRGSYHARSGVEQPLPLPLPIGRLAG
jgi:hypothetical protein